MNKPSIAPTRATRGCLLLIVLCCTGITGTFSHEGTGEPIIADIVVPEEIFIREPAEFVFRLFSMAQIEDTETSSDETFMVHATVVKGSRVLKIEPEKVTEKEFVAQITFPTPGVWSMKAHVSKAGSPANLLHDGDPSIVELSVRVEGSSKIRTFVIIAIAFLGVAGLLFGARVVARRRH